MNTDKVPEASGHGTDDFPSTQGKLSRTARRRARRNEILANRKDLQRQRRKEVTEPSRHLNDGRTESYSDGGMHVSHKEHNRLMHAMHGNTSKPTSAKKKGKRTALPPLATPPPTTRAASAAKAATARTPGPPTHAPADPQPPTPAWFVPHSEHNRLMHALHGNGSRSIVQRTFLDNAPKLEGQDISLENFLSWRIDAKSFLEMQGLEDWTFGETPTQPAGGAELIQWKANLAEGLRYVAGMVEDKDLRTTLTMHAKKRGDEGWNFLKKEFLRKHSAQSAYMKACNTMSLTMGQSVIFFRNHWLKFVLQLEPLPDASILCDMFIAAISRKTDEFYEMCISGCSEGRDDYLVFTKTLAEACQDRRDRIHKRETPTDLAALKTEVAKLRLAQSHAIETSPKAGSRRANALNYSKGDSRNAGDDKSKLVHCARCDKMHAGGRAGCRLPKAKCKFKFPNGKQCNGDHHINQCWGKNPKLIRDPKMREKYEKRHSVKGLRTGCDSDSDSDVSTFFTTFAVCEGCDADGDEEAMPASVESRLPCSDEKSESATADENIANPRPATWADLVDDDDQELPSLPSTWEVSQHAQPPPPDWHVSHREHNRQMHAMHGNGASSDKSGRSRRRANKPTRYVSEPKPSKPPVADATIGTLDLPALLTRGERRYLNVDTGASNNIIHDAQCIIAESHRPTKVMIRTGNRRSPITSFGGATFQVKTSRGDTYELTRSVFFAPDFTVNLLSVPEEQEVHGSKFHFNSDHRIVLTEGIVIPFKPHKRQYLLRYEPPTSTTALHSSTGGECGSHAGTATGPAPPDTGRFNEDRYDRLFEMLQDTSLQAPGVKGQVNTKPVPPMPAIIDPASPEDASQMPTRPQQREELLCGMRNIHPEVDLVHRRMAHISPEAMKHLHRCTIGPSARIERITNRDASLTCNICPLAKFKQKAHKQNKVRTDCTKFGDSVAMDLCGPLKPLSINEAFRYVSVFIDVATNWVLVYFARRKSDQRKLHQRFTADAAKLLDGKAVREFHSDNGGEYRDGGYLADILESGSSRSFSTPYTPNQNQLAEGAMWRLFTMARALLFDSGLPLVHWPYAVYHASWIMNRTPRYVKRLEKWTTAYELVKGRPPNISILPVWGCQTFAIEPAQTRSDKLLPRGKFGYFVGFNRNIRAANIFLPNGTDLTKGRVMVARSTQYREQLTPRTLRAPGAVLPPTPAELPQPEPKAKPAEADKPEDTDTPAIEALPEEIAVPFGGAPEQEEELDPRQRDSAEGEPESAIATNEADRLVSDNAASAPLPDTPDPPEGDLRRSARIRSRGCVDKAAHSTTTFLLPGGYKLVKALNATSFDVSEALMATQVYDGIELADALINSDDQVTEAFAAKTKEFLNEEGGMFSSHSIPKTVFEALKSGHKEEWVKAMGEELNAHIKNGTWILVPIASLPKGKKVVGSTWAFDLKRTVKGLIERYKARLCAQGFSQREGEDFIHTYSNTVSYDTLRLVLALAAMHDLELTSLDIKTAYLNGFIEEGFDIYMLPPRGFRFNGKDSFEFAGHSAADPRYACKLVRSIYGLKQSGRRWEARLVSELIKLGCIRCIIDPCLWKYVKGDALVMITIYVDDIVMATNSRKLRDELVRKLKELFDVRNEGPLTWLFGTAIDQDITKGTVSIHQTLYIDEVVRAFGTKDLRKQRVVPSIEEALHLMPLPEDQPRNENYRSLLGKLLWIAIISRPDISFAVVYLTRFGTCAGDLHLSHAVRIVDYLAATRNKKITYRRTARKRLYEHLVENTEGLPDLQGHTILFSDASHGGEKPMAGWTAIEADGPIGWAAFRERTTPISSCEGEYVAATKATIAGLAFKQTKRFLGFEVLDPIYLFCDNKAAVQLSESATNSKRLKHVATRIAFLREFVESNEIKLIHIKGTGQIADLFTKPLSPDKFHPLRSFFVE